MDLNPQAKCSNPGPSKTSEDNKCNDAQEIGAKENLDHAVTILEPPSCRACLEGEVEDGSANDLMELHCNCKGHMSKMHRNCIIMWYGPRMILDRCFKCKICKTILHPATQLAMKQAVANRENHGRDILFKALKAKIYTWPHVDLESAATYQELCSLIRITNCWGCTLSTTRSTIGILISINERTRHPRTSLNSFGHGVVLFILAFFSRNRKSS